MISWISCGMVLWRLPCSLGRWSSPSLPRARANVRATVTISPNVLFVKTIFIVEKGVDQVAMIDDVEVGRRVSPRLRVASRSLMPEE